MEKVIDFIYNNWGTIATVIGGVYTLGSRLWPTEKNWDFVSKVLKFLDMVIPNLKRDSRDGSITQHCVIWLLILLPLISSGQNNVFMKGANSYNVSDTSFQQNNRSALQTLYGNTGNFYFDKARNKWRIWAGTCTTCSVDSAYVDLLNPGSVGGSNLFFKNGLTKQADSTTVKLGGTIINNTEVSLGTTLGKLVFDQSGYALGAGSMGLFYGNTNFSGDYQYVAVFGNKIELFDDRSATTGLFAGISINTNTANSKIDIVGDVGTFRGLLYGNDYTSNYTDRSLTDRGFVNTHLAGATFTNSPSNGNVPTFNGTNWTFSTPATTAPAGSNTEIQFNNAGAFGASGNLTWTNGSNLLSVGTGGNITSIFPTDIELAGGSSTYFATLSATSDPTLSMLNNSSGSSTTFSEGLLTQSLNGVIIKSTTNNQNIFTVEENGSAKIIEAIESGGVRQLGLYGVTPVAQYSTGVTLTNNVTSGGTANTIADFTSLSVYATDAPTIRDDIYQLAEKVRKLEAALKALGVCID